MRKKNPKPRTIYKVIGDTGYFRPLIFCEIITLLTSRYGMQTKRILPALEYISKRKGYNSKLPARFDFIHQTFLINYIPEFVRAFNRFKKKNYKIKFN